MTDKTVLGRNLKAARGRYKAEDGRQGLSLDQLAELAGVSAWAIGAIERGETRVPWAPTLANLASVLGTTAEVLLGDSE